MRQIALVLLVAVSATVGCTAVPGTPNPRTGTATTAPATPTPRLAPPVPAPRNARGVAACNLLTTEQKRAVGADLSTEKPATQGAATRCGWRTTAREGSLLVTTAPDFPVGGLEGLYLVRSTYAVFQPGELDGFPTVRAERSDTGEKDCTFYIGVADDQLIWATASFPFGDRPRPSCPVARQMGSDMIANLPPLH